MDKHLKASRHGEPDQGLLRAESDVVMEDQPAAMLKPPVSPFLESMPLALPGDPSRPVNIVLDALFCEVCCNDVHLKSASLMSGC